VVDRKTLTGRVVFNAAEVWPVASTLKQRKVEVGERCRVEKPVA